MRQRAEPTDSRHLFSRVRKNKHKSYDRRRRTDAAYWRSRVFSIRRSAYLRRGSSPKEAATESRDQTLQTGVFRNLLLDAKRALEVRRDARREDRDGEQYRILELNDLDVAIGVPVRLPQERRVIAPGQIAAPRFIGPDGVEITLGDAWSPLNMRRDPRLRTR